jgi:peptidoglycan/xylan/chitin deacetylase (PgdA/CDA1 family)
MNSRLRFILLWVFIFTLGLSVYGAVNFSGLDLGDTNQLLFQSHASPNGSLEQTALFTADVQKLSIRQLTLFPENMDVLDGGRILQIRNVYGTLRLSIGGGLPQGINGFPSFMNGAPILEGRSETMAPSPDGRWLLIVEPVTAAYGNLSLVSIATGERTLIAKNVERPGVVFPACWSPDSRVFVYSRGGKLYYRPVTSEAIVVDERYRLIGEGRREQVVWGAGGDFFYIRGSTVYRVRSSELFARALYADFLEIGLVAGKIPFEFDPNFDSFWVAPDGRSLLLAKGGRNLFYYPLGIDDYGSDFQSSLPYLLLPRSCVGVRVLWSPSGILTIFAELPPSEKKTTLLYRLDLSGDQVPQKFTSLDDPLGSGAALSPDGNRALVWGSKGAALYDYINWKVVATLDKRPTIAARWIGNEEFVVADDATIEKVSISGKRDLICLSQAEKYGFEEKTGLVVAYSGDAWYTTDGNRPWTRIKEPKIRRTSTVSSNYRVYLEDQSSGIYTNLPMVRNLSGIQTTALILRNGSSYDPIPSLEKDPLGPSDPFNHGKRTGRREVALSFDLMDDAEGLPGVLKTLDQFKVRATFFLNGEFIRRHPEAARELSLTNQEIGSLFFAPIDVSDSRYRIDDDFIRRGLARNEDEYFQATSHELSLLWHAPYYSLAPQIQRAALQAGYQTVGRDMDPLDWVSSQDALRGGLPYRSASDMVDWIMEKKQCGSIIPIRLGIPNGGRQDYLFSRLDVLLDALLRRGYSVVPVSVLMEHAK